MLRLPRESILWYVIVSSGFHSGESPAMSIIDRDIQPEAGSECVSATALNHC